MEQRVQDFINISKYTPDHNNLFWTLVNNRDSNGDEQLQYVTKYPEVLLMTLNNYLVFDYFYEKVITESYHPSNGEKWQAILIAVIKLVDDTSDPNIIKADKKYILKLQSTNKTLTKLFSLLMHEDFDMGDPEFLVYSIIARGELNKLELMGKHYVIEDYPGVLDVALKYGQHMIISYFINDLKLNVKYYGKIIDLENYKDNQRYLVYKEHLHTDSILSQTIDISRQNYALSIKLILDHYEYPITCSTLEKWCELIRNNPNVCAIEVLPLILNRIHDHIPLTKDFKEFNRIIFGKEWSDRECLIEHCLSLEKRLDELNAKYDVVLNKLRHIQSKSKD
jgi:hypothetical protein